MTGPPPHLLEKTTCAVRAFGVVEATAQALAALRRQPGPADGWPTPPNLLNHADDQTVAALAAVLQVIHNSQLQSESFTDWAVVAAPRFPGRVSFAVSLDKFRELGSLSVSPVIVPFRSLHSPSSLISLALQSHGPSLGVGGCHDGIAQALLMGLTLRHEQDVQGVWVVATGWDPEVVAESRAADGPLPVCRAAALALLPEAASAHGSRLRIVPRSESRAEDPAALNLPDLIRFLTDAPTNTRPRKWSCPLNSDCDLELSVEESDVEWFARSA